MYNHGGRTPQPPWPHLIIDDGLEKKREHLVTHPVWPHWPENPPGRPRVEGTLTQLLYLQCNTLVVRCSRQLIGPADWVFVTLGPLRCD